MRIAIAEIAQETDSFSPIVATQDDFETNGLYFGQEILTLMRGVGPLGGFLEVANDVAPDATLIPSVRAWGAAGGTITQATFQMLLDSFVAGLREAMPVDAVFLSLHGAAAAEDEDDVEGAVLQAARAIVGETVAIVVAVDHHANITSKMVQHATALIGHETQPHDPVATGRKAAKLLFRVMQKEVQVTRGWRKIPMITPQDQFLTSQGPMKVWFDRARELETRPEVLDVSPYPMQPWLDVAEGGWAVVVHTDNNPELADVLAAEMAELAWELRDQFWVSERVAPADAVQMAVESERGLIILSDTGDSVYGGAPGDSTAILKALVEANVPCRSLVPMVDSESLEQAMAAGVGAEITLEVGGKIDSVFSKPVRVTGKVGGLCAGLQTILPDRGLCDIGRTALLEVGEVRIVLLGHRNFAINHPILYQHLGLDVAAAKIVVVKTASNFQFFAPWRSGLIRVDSPGMTQSDLKAFAWKRIPRPIYPLDDSGTFPK